MTRSELKRQHARPAAPTYAAEAEAVQSEPRLANLYRPNERQVGTGKKAAKDVDGVMSGVMDGVLRGPPSACPRTPPCPSLQDFRSRFEADFDVWVSPAAQLGLEGAIVLIGEDHGDQHCQQLVEGVLKVFDRCREDRLFVEGSDRFICLAKALQFSIPSGACRLMEENGLTAATLTEASNASWEALKACVTYLLERFPSSRSQLAPPSEMKEYSPATQKQYDRFVNERVPRIVPKDVPGWNLLVARLNRLRTEYGTVLASTLSARDANMVRMLQSNRHAKGLNFAIVGALHLRGMRPLLLELPTIVMIPKSVIAKHPEVAKSLQNWHDEL